MIAPAPRRSGTSEMPLFQRLQQEDYRGNICSRVTSTSTTFYSASSFELGVACSVARVSGDVLNDLGPLVCCIPCKPYVPSFTEHKYCPAIDTIMRPLTGLISSNLIFLIVLHLVLIGPISASISRLFWQQNDRQAVALTRSSDCTNQSWLSQRQKELCFRNPSTVRAVIEGVHSAATVCHNQFTNERWNCSIAASESYERGLNVGSRESAYVVAISSGGVSHTIARACARGAIDDCGCGKKPRNSMGSDFTWSGCSDNVRYGNTFVRKFIEAEEKKDMDSRAMMNLHNSQVARRILASSLTKQCKCHGVSGSCVTKTCWKVVPKLEDFGKFLKDKYVSVSSSGSDLVATAHNSTSGGRAERYLRGDGEGKVAKTNLVFLDASPNYCSDSSTQGRECTDGNCAILCCGRGYNIKREIVSVSCKCKFLWCCEVKCDTCLSVVERRFCK
uniref:Protein Wnt n=1 Tax=Steinernema glaseri TaxID=37863 RepID=A0A1I7ZPE6_9BILA